MKRRLTRSSTNRLFAGVCGGLGEYFGIDPTWIRLTFVGLLPFTYFISALVYVACVFLIPENRNIQRTDVKADVSHTLHRLQSTLDSRSSNRKSNKGRK